MTSKPQKPNLDLIQRVQQARLMHDSTAKPSEINAVYWIETKCEVHCAKPTVNAGQWVLETTLENVDSIWEKVKQATQAGHLGYKSKVSTASRLGESPQSRRICVRTYNAEDSVDIQRVVAFLRTLDADLNWYYEKD